MGGADGALVEAGICLLLYGPEAVRRPYTETSNCLRVQLSFLGLGDVRLNESGWRRFPARSPFCAAERPVRNQR